MQLAACAILFLVCIVMLHGLVIVNSWYLFGILIYFAVMLCIFTYHGHRHYFFYVYI